MYLFSIEMPQWNYYFYFFNAKVPFRRTMSKEEETPPVELPRETFGETKDRPGKYILLSRNLTSYKAYYVFTYEGNKNPANKATWNQFTPLQIMDEPIIPKGALLEDKVLNILKYQGRFALVIDICMEEGPATEASIAKPLTYPAVAGTGTQFLFNKYEQHSELFKTQLFAIAVKEKLGRKFIVRDQVEAFYYCEFNARVDLAISKKATVSISTDPMEEGQAPSSPSSPIPKTFTEETNVTHKLYQTLAGMLCIASEDATNNYIANEVDVDIIESYGLSISGDKAYVLKMELSMDQGRVVISKSEDEVNLLTAFNYVLEKIE